MTEVACAHDLLYVNSLHLGAFRHGLQFFLVTVAETCTLDHDKESMILE